MTDSKSSKRAAKTQSARALVSKILSPSFRRQGFARTEVITRWPAIAGEHLARHCIPERLAFAPGENREGTLHVRSEGTFALELQHLEPQLIEKINTFYGYRAVARLAIKQGPVEIYKDAPKPPKIEPSPETEAEAAGAVADLPEGKLRDALKNLGRSVLGSEH